MRFGKIRAGNRECERMHANRAAARRAPSSAKAPPAFETVDKFDLTPNPLSSFVARGLAGAHVAVFCTGFRGAHPLLHNVGEGRRGDEALKNRQSEKIDSLLRGGRLFQARSGAGVGACATPA